MTLEQTSTTALTAEDRFAINDCLARYCFALDDRDFGKLEQVFAPDIVWQYGTFGSGTDSASLVDMITASLSTIAKTQHLLGTSVAEATPEGAYARTYVSAQHVQHAAEAGHLFMVAGWYHDHLVRVDDGWRIARRTYENVWLEGNPAVFEG